MPGGRSFWIIVLSLLAVNYVIMAVFAPGREPSVRIPYSSTTDGAPGFLQQIDKGNVARVKTQGATVTGEFKKEVRYPDAKADAAKNFETELPSFVIYNSSRPRGAAGQGTRSRSRPRRSTTAAGSSRA